MWRVKLSFFRPFASNTHVPYGHWGQQFARRRASFRQRPERGSKMKMLIWTFGSWATASLSNADGIETKRIWSVVLMRCMAARTKRNPTPACRQTKAHSSTGAGNVYTIGCVLSAIASAGADPDKQFAYGGKTSPQTIKDTPFTAKRSSGSTAVVRWPRTWLSDWVTFCTEATSGRAIRSRRISTAI